MFISHYFFIAYLIKNVISIHPGAQKINIRGRKVVQEKGPIHQYDYRKYYKDLFQSMDIQPHLYGNNATVVNKKLVREDFNDDVEHDKHTLIFNQVYHFYRRMLDRRKADMNKTKVEKAKERMKGSVKKMEEAMQRKLRREEKLNHKQVVRERRAERMENNPNENEETKSKNPKTIDVSKVKNVLHDIENYIHSKVGVPLEPNAENTPAASKEAIRNGAGEELKEKMVNLFGINKKTPPKGQGRSRRPTWPKTSKTTTRRPTTPDLVEWALNHTDDSDSSEERKLKVKGDGYWDRIKNRRLNLTRRARMKTTMTSDEAEDYWRAWTPDPRYTFGLEEWNGSAVMNQTFMSYEEENATFTTLPANWLTWLYSGLSEDLANQTTYESCPTHEIYDRYYNATWSVEFQHTPPKNHTFYWPHKDMFKYTFHTSDASEWDEREFYQFPPNPTYYDRNRVTEYLTWRPVKRADFITTKRPLSTWTELYYTNNSAEGLYVAPTVFWIDARTPSKRTFGSWEQVESKELTPTPRTLPPYPDPPINFTCRHCEGTPAIFSHENNLNNHELEHIKNDTYKIHPNSSEERRAKERLPTWDGYFMFSQDSEDKRAGITQTRYKDATYVSSIDYSHEMRNWNQSFKDRMMKRHNEGKPIEDWDRDSVVYNYYQNKFETTTMFYDSDYYYNSAEWAELQKFRARQAEKEKLKANLKAYMAQEFTTFPDSFTEPSEEFAKRKMKPMNDSLEIFGREFLRNLTRSTKPTTPEPILDLMRDLATIYQRFSTPEEPTTTRKRRPFKFQEELDKYAYSDTVEDYKVG